MLPQAGVESIPGPPRTGLCPWGGVRRNDPQIDECSPAPKGPHLVRALATPLKLHPHKHIRSGIVHIRKTLRRHMLEPHRLIQMHRIL